MEPVAVLLISLKGLALLINQEDVAVALLTNQKVREVVR